MIKGVSLPALITKFSVKAQGSRKIGSSSGIVASSDQGCRELVERVGLAEADACRLIVGDCLGEELCRSRRIAEKALEASRVGERAGLSEGVIEPPGGIQLGMLKGQSLVDLALPAQEAVHSCRKPYGYVKPATGGGKLRDR